MGYWDEVYEAAEESGGAGGVIAKGWVDFGFFVYAKGFTGDDNIKKFFSSRKLGKAKAREAAVKFAKENGEDPRPQDVIQVCAYLDGAVKADGSPVGWNCNQYQTIPTWTLKKSLASAGKPSAARTMMDILETLGVEPNKEGWFQFSWQSDPYKASLGDEGKTESYIYQDESGSDVRGYRVPSFMYPVAVFESKEAAMATVSSGGSSGGGGAMPEFVPEGTEEWWADAVTDIKEQKEMHALNNQQLREYVKENYEIELSMGDLIRILK